MEHFIEGVLELLFGLAKNKPDKMPEIEYKDSFVVKNNTKKIVIRIVASVLIVALFALLSIFVDNDTRVLFLIFVILGLIILLLALSALSYRCVVTDEILSQRFFFFFKKTVNWRDIICVRKCESTDDNNVLITLHNGVGKCVLDIPTEMQNAWYIVKMAEHKNIEIREEKDLSIKQISKL